MLSNAIYNSQISQKEIEYENLMIELARKKQEEIDNSKIEETEETADEKDKKKKELAKKEEEKKPVEKKEKPADKEKEKDKKKRPDSKAEQRQKTDEDGLKTMKSMGEEPLEDNTYKELMKDILSIDDEALIMLIGKKNATERRLQVYRDYVQSKVNSSLELLNAK